MSKKTKIQMLGNRRIVVSRPLESKSHILSSVQGYFNGNYYVIRREGYLEKIAMRNGEDLIADFPDSIDLKVTNKCSHGCPFCHESSVPNGKSFDLDRTIKILSQLPEKPIEIAIGGGNIMEDIDKVKDLLEWINKNTPWLSRATVNIQDVRNLATGAVINGIGAVGISINSVEDYKELKKFFLEDIMSPFPPRYPFYTTIHVILGIFPENLIGDLIQFAKDEMSVICKPSILFLGYKSWGRGEMMYPKEESINKIREIIRSIILQGEPDVPIVFDNLAIEQLKLREIIPDIVWEHTYLGDEGSCSMYIDAVNGEFARNSRYPERVSWDKVNLLDYFKSLR